jgi:hypothetical protein
MTSDPTQLLLLYVVMPACFAAGIADWLCHRASYIEHTTGDKESLLHLLMFGEVAIPLAAALFLEINAFVIAVMIAAFFIHEATALWDVSYAVSRRYISPIEQHVHSFLEMIPLMAIVFVIVLHWSQFSALLGLGTESASFALQLKYPPLSVAYVSTVLVAAFESRSCRTIEYRRSTALSDRERALLLASRSTNWKL